MTAQLAFAIVHAGLPRRSRPFLVAVDPTRVDLVDELIGEGFESWAQGGVVAGLGVADESPAGVHVAGVVAAGPWRVGVGADGGCVDVLAAGDVHPYPDGGEGAFVVVPVGVGAGSSADRPARQAVDQLLPLVQRDCPAA